MEIIGRKVKVKKISEKIGNVSLNLEFYSLSDIYSDGDEGEERLLNACCNDDEEKLLQESRDWEVLYHLSEIRHNVIEWLPIEKNASILEIGAGCGGITGILSEKSNQVTCVELSKRRSMINAYRHKDRENIEIFVGNFQKIEKILGKYDVVTLIGVWEYSAAFIHSEDPFGEMLRIAKKHLKKEGRLIIAIENKMGMKYINGALEDHMGKPYSGINDYISREKVRTFSKNEIEKYLFDGGFAEYSFYYPMPDYKLPNVIFSDRQLPNPGNLRFFGKEYQHTRICNFYEAAFSDQICSDGQFPYFANSFLIVTGQVPDVIFATYQRERRRRFRFATFITENGGCRKVEKKPLTKEAALTLRKIDENAKKWNGTISSVIPASAEKEDHGISEYIYGDSLENDFYMCRHNIRDFISRFKDIRNMYLMPTVKLKEFEITDEFRKIFGDVTPDKCMTTSYTNVDLVLSNMKRDLDGKVRCFDFEWIFDFPIPYEFPIFRAAYLLYDKYSVYLKNQMNRKQFLSEIGFDDGVQEIFFLMERKFMEYVTGDGYCEEYTRQYRKGIIMPDYRVYE